MKHFYFNKQNCFQSHQSEMHKLKDIKKEMKLILIPLEMNQTKDLNYKESFHYMNL